MTVNQASTAVLVTLALLLGSCASQPDQAASPESTEAPVAEAPAAAPEADHSAPSQGGQVVEVGAYHLELVPEVEASGTHLDLFLQQGDTHDAIAGATVTGQVQLPDGSQKDITFEYDAAGQHYVALLPETAMGEYKVAVLTDINGEKANARFTFSK